MKYDLLPIDSWTNELFHRIRGQGISKPENVVFAIFFGHIRDDKSRFAAQIADIIWPAPVIAVGHKGPGAQKQNNRD